ncbi:aspartate carbamoyltransferase [Candidatus Roizmanbacteria bacterium]|nr:aspartate carbamoyltransferase [Candidatus Roizmanbacteria bacterium]
MSIKNLASINQSFYKKDLISIDQLDPLSIQIIFRTTQHIIDLLQKNEGGDILKGVLATLLFFEPSSRTFSSFAAAIKRLGGVTVEYQNPTTTSSTVKGETLEDTVRVFENYSDIIIMRHPMTGAPIRAAQAAHAPVVNAGDGSGEHPTQALLDMVTLFQRFGRVDHLKGVIAGDLLYGRTVHSLIKAFAMFEGNELYLLSPPELSLPPELMKEFTKKGIKLTQLETEKEIPTDCQFWYWTRVQKERFSDIKEYERVKNRYVVTPELLKERGNKEMVIMHPLPRVGEIDNRIDSDPRALYLTNQVKNGMYIRMALIALIMGKL